MLWMALATIFYAGFQAGRFHVSNPAEESMLAVANAKTVEIKPVPIQPVQEISHLLKQDFTPTMSRTLDFSAAQGLLNQALPIERVVEEPIPQTLPTKDTEPAIVQVPDIKPQKEVSSLKPAKPLISKQVSPEQKSAEDYRQAIDMLQHGRVSEAKVLLQSSLDLQPLNQDVRMTLLSLLVENKQRDEAITLLKSAIALAPHQVGFVQALARLEIESGNVVEALATLEKGLPYAGQNSQYHGFYAALLQRAERHEDAVKHYQFALASESSAASWVGLGISLQALGDNAAAHEAYLKAQGAGLGEMLAQFVGERLLEVSN
jgi:MSHA biogenesis protein MshN